jgi:drug/metabolite transporter (DMT)-like permease
VNPQRPTLTATSPTPPLLPALALTFNALVWGTSWWPLRQLQQHGLHPLWSTLLVYGLSMIVIVAVRPAALRQLLGTPALWVLLIAAGTTNAAFNWGVVIGDVVRVVLLFYLMPLWAVILARLLLGEALTLSAAARAALAVAGAAVVLWPEVGADGSAWPLPHTLADALGLLGGFSFALNNVMLRREAHRPEEGRALAMFMGGAAVSGGLGAVLAQQGLIAGPVPLPPAWALGALILSVLFLAGNLALQYGAARLPANVTAVVMLTEVVFASVSALALGGGVLTTQLLIGGLMILLAAMLSSLEPG